MEISIENFSEKLPLIRKSIATAEFIAIDSEFSGNKVTLDDKPHEFDTFEDKYRKNSRAIKQFLAFQMGVTTFFWSDLKKKYIGRPFNFLIYPRSVLNEKHHKFNVSAHINFF